MSISIPPTLPILPLPADTVLFPNLLLSIQLQSRHAIALVRSVVNDAATSSSSPGSSALVIACVPLKPKDPSSTSATAKSGQGEPKVSGNAGDDTATSSDSGNLKDEKGLKVIRIPSDRDLGRQGVDLLPDGRPYPENLFEYGTAARIIRLERLSSGGFLAVLEGLARISIDPATYPSPPALSSFYTARTIVLPVSPPLDAKDASILTRLKDIAMSVLRGLESSSTPLPPTFDRKLRAQLSRLSPSSCGTTLDSLFSTLPISSSTSLSHADKCALLAQHQLVPRLETGIDLLERVYEAIKLDHSTSTSVDKPVVNRRQRELALMQQLLAIKQELDQLAASDPSPLGVPRSSTSSSAAPKAAARRAKKLSMGASEDEDGEEGDDLAELEKKIEEKHFSDEARKVALRELKRLKKTPPQGAEYGVIRNYLDTLLAIPWTAADATPLALSREFIDEARRKLDEDHYGLHKIKRRLLEWLAVLRLQQEQTLADERAASTPMTATVAAATELSTSTAVVPYTPLRSPTPTSARASPTSKSPILLLHGPPGVGKTSIARSLAEAMGRKFVRISLGGVRDEAEIRGHRRTYVGAMTGKIVAAMRKASTSNPVILLDEIDKMGHASHHGDPSAAMLEVLDPEQNWCFEDHYLGVPIDLSRVLFIATANSLDTIPEPLYDRMEPVELSGYIHDEKLHIARQKLLPKQLDANALDSTLVNMSDSTLLFLIQHYTREAGVRSLERVIGAVCRSKAVEYAQARDRYLAEADERKKEIAGTIGIEMVVGKGYKPNVGEEDLDEILGGSRFEEEELDERGKVGVATGLAYQGSGNGGVLHIETTLMAGSGRFHLTGQLGDVISESARLAFAWVKSHAHDLGIAAEPDKDVFKHVDLHLHLPSGSVKKDGPSAGVAIVVAIVSLLRGIAPRSLTAMTGEITLRGDVTPVGGIKEKLLGAHRSGIRTVILPVKNRKDVFGTDSGLPDQLKKEVTIIFVKDIYEALQAALPRLDGEGGTRLVDPLLQSRL